MTYPTVSINIVTWNSMEFLGALLESIMNETYLDFNVLVIDNGSTDGIEEFLKLKYPNVAFLRNARNLGFAAAHNQGIRYALEHWSYENLSDKYILVANPDVIFTPNFLEQILSTARTHPEVGSFGGKLLRAFGENLSDEVMKETIHSDRIDSTGLNPHRNRSITDRGAGEMDSGQYNEQEKVFGVSGALALYRASALQDVRYKDEFFDQDFFAYKEDVDLAWRLQNSGWDALFVPSTVAYHYRGMYGPEKFRFFQKLSNRRKKSAVRNFFSTRNHWLMLMKNLRITDSLLAFFWIMPYETAKLIYTLLFEKHGLKTICSTIRLSGSMFKKRSDIFSKSRRSPKDLRAWFV